MIFNETCQTRRTSGTRYSYTTLLSNVYQNSRLYQIKTSTWHRFDCFFFLLFFFVFLSYNYIICLTWWPDVLIFVEQLVLLFSILRVFLSCTIAIRTSKCIFCYFLQTCLWLNWTSWNITNRKFKSDVYRPFVFTFFVRLLFLRF